MIDNAAGNMLQNQNITFPNVGLLNLWDLLRCMVLQFGQLPA